MKIYKGLALVLFFILLPVYVHSQDYTADKQQTASYQENEEDGEEGDVIEPADTPETESVIKINTAKKTQEPKQIKANSICIGEDCRSKWPSFKCANYDRRPAGETGDEFCGKMGQTCVDVSIGSGQSFFGECSVPANSFHKCRCCWVE